MEKRKDNIVVKINTERSFADEVYKKYRSERYGIGICCSSNLPSYIKDKYLCDFQDAQVTQYDSITRSKTTYAPPSGGAKDDENRPGWVDELCGNTKGDVEVYFYYDATSLGLAQVQAAYYASTAWVALVRAEGAVNSKKNTSCRTSASQTITEYHTTVFGERWVDWGTSSMTGILQNSGSCGGHSTTPIGGGSCVTGTVVNVDPIPSRNYGTNDCGSAADSTIPLNQGPTNKFWSILTWAQNNNITMYNGNVAGVNGGASFPTTNTIGMAPKAVVKNVLGVCFIDESSSNTWKQPYHDRQFTGTGTATWNAATDGTGTVTPCWAADYTEFIMRRNLFLAQGSDYTASFFCYPSEPVSAGPSHYPFPLHALGGITSGDRTILDGTFVVAPYNTLTNLTAITTSNPYFSSGYGALDQQGWGIEPAELPFTASGLAEDLNSFVDLTSCNDSECFFAIVRDKNGNVVVDHPIVFNGGVVAYTDESGMARWCVENASVNRTHTLDLCYCITTTGGCASTKLAITLIDDCLLECPATPFIACEEVPEPISSGNIREGCTDPAADNYDPNAVTDDGSCIFCASLNITYTKINATEASDGSCQDDGEIGTTITGGTPSYTYNWTKNGVQFATVQNISGLCGGIYIFTVTDAAGCVETLTVFLDQPNLIIYGCDDSAACNYNAATTDPDGSCLYSGCTSSAATNEDFAATADCNCVPPGDAAYQNSVGWDSCCIFCAYGCMDPTASNYDATATCDDGSCDFCIYGCMYDTLSCNYNPDATCEATTLNPGTGICTPPASMDLGAASDGVGNPNPLNPDGTGSTADSITCIWHGVGSYPYENGVVAYGAHVNKGLGSSFDLDLLPSGNDLLQTGFVRTESYYFMLGTGVSGSDNPPLVIGQTYCITWAQIVLKLVVSQACADCLMGGWGVKIDNLSGVPDVAELNTASSIYDPVALGELTYADDGVTAGQTQYGNYHNSACNQNTPGAINNTAGAPEGSASRWEERCVTFVASETEHRIHLYALTDFNACDDCRYNPGQGSHGSYIGISNVNIDTSCAGDCDC